MDIEQKLLARIPQGWGKYISCREGWYPILEDLDKKLAWLDPEYKIAQVKEKFGALRFYFDTEAGATTRSIMYDCVSAAEYKSSFTCEYCGTTATVKLREGGWVKTLCDDCWVKKQEERVKREQALDEIVKINQEAGLYDEEFK